MLLFFLSLVWNDKKDDNIFNTMMNGLNTFIISLLNLINILVSKNIKPSNIKNTSYSPNLFEKIIKFDLADNDDIFNIVFKNVGKNIFKIK